MFGRLAMGFANVRAGTLESTNAGAGAGCTNLDTVVNHIVHKMAALGMRAYSLVHGKHNKRTTAFAKACLAACYVTIPTSEHYPTRLRLLLLCAQVSLVNGLITQAEARAPAP